MISYDILSYCCRIYLKHRKLDSLYINMKMLHGRAITSFICILILTFAHAQSQDRRTEQPVPPPAFILELKVSINDKLYNPTNISLSLNPTSAPNYSFNLSAVNFNKNVSVITKLFAWYNNQWVVRQSQSLRITGQQTDYRLLDHLLLKLLKLNSKNYEYQLFHNKTACILRNSTLLISYDPESSLLVSRLEDPSLFVSSTKCSIIPKDQKASQPLQITISLQLIHRTDLFIDYKNHITQLNELQSKLKKQKVMLEWKPMPPFMFEPVQMWKTIRQNVKTLQTQIKKINQIIDLATKKGYRNLIMPQVRPVNFQKDLSPLFLIAKSNNLWNVTLVDALLPAYQFTYHQTNFLDRIGYLKQAIRRNLHSQNYDRVKYSEKLAEIAYWALIILSAIWVLLDIIAYKNINNNIGLSQSFGFFLNAWLLLQIINLSIWVGSLVRPLAGLVLFFSLLLVHYLLIRKSQMLFTAKKHSFSTFDRILTKWMFNTLIIAIMASIIIHTWLIRDIRYHQLVLWTFSQLQELLSQYYYCLVFIPQIIINCKLTSTSSLSKKRLLVFLLIGILRNTYQVVIDGSSHWSLGFLYLKQEFLWLILVLQKIIYGNRTIIAFEEIQNQKQSQNQQSQQSLSELKEKQT